MVTAYVMVKANTGAADRLKGEILDVEGVTDAHIVAGDVDVIVKLEVDSPAAVKDVAADAIRRIEGVENTHTYVAMD